VREEQRILGGGSGGVAHGAEGQHGGEAGGHDLDGDGEQRGEEDGHERGHEVAGFGAEVEEAGGCAGGDGATAGVWWFGGGGVCLVDGGGGGVGCVGMCGGVYVVARGAVGCCGRGCCSYRKMVRAAGRVGVLCCLCVTGNDGRERGAYDRHHSLRCGLRRICG